jgi:hypothetical protein
LYEAFPAEQARNLWERFEVHHTPKRAGWLNMAELEIGVMSRRCLARGIPALETMKNEAAAWVRNRDAARRTVHWRFTTPDASLKLQRLYPKI